MKIYHYDKNTGEIQGESEARTDPRAGTPITPAHATTEKPPTTGIKQVAKFAGNAWTIVPDHRGAKGFDSARVEHEVTEIDTLPDPSWTSQPAPPTAAELSAEIDAELFAIDIASIRSIREYIAGKPDAPQILKDHETSAINKRGQK